MSIPIDPEPLGSLLTFSCRYALGRGSYAVYDVARLVREYAAAVQRDDVRTIARDIAREVEQAGWSDPWARGEWEKALGVCREVLGEE